MNNRLFKTLPKRIATKNRGIFYKEIEKTTIDDRGNLKTKIVDKNYIIRYRYGGKEHLITLGKYSEGIRESYCKDELNKYLIMAKNGELPPQIAQRMQKIVTLNSVAERHYDYKALYNRSNNLSKQIYKLHIKPILGEIDIVKITISDIEQLQQLKAKTYSNKHTNNIIGQLSSIYNYALKHEIILSTPTKLIKPLKVDNSRDRYLSIQEVTLLLNSIKEDEQIYLFILLALNTGARVGAICKLFAKDINFQREYIDMLDEKNAIKYSCFLKNQELIDILKIRISKVGYEKPILDDGYKESNLTDRIKRKVGKILNNLFNNQYTFDKDRVVVHTLRHTFASQLAINGTPILTIQKLMNHRDINQTLRYAKLAPQQGVDAIDKLYKS